MLEYVKEYDCKKKSVINGKIVAKMWAYTDYEETLNIIITANEDDYRDNKDEVEDDIKYFIWWAFKDIVDRDIHIEKLHSEIPYFVDVDINTTIGMNAPNHPEAVDGNENLDIVENTEEDAEENTEEAEEKEVTVDSENVGE